jgi:hypothetical protein
MWITRFKHVWFSRFESKHKCNIHRVRIKKALLYKELTMSVVPKCVDNNKKIHKDYSYNDDCTCVFVIHKDYSYNDEACDHLKDEIWDEGFR